jgi:Ca-activated chloride channel family protein
MLFGGGWGGLLVVSPLGKGKLWRILRTADTTSGWGRLPAPHPSVFGGSMSVRQCATTLIAAIVVIACLTGSRPAAQDLIFKSSAERVTIAVVARNRNGRPLSGLSAGDFQVLDDGRSRTILDFRNDANAVSVALLLDTSGSMRIGPKLQRAVDVGNFLLASMQEGTDEAGLFVFDKSVRAASPFSSDFAQVRSALSVTHPFGSTSLYDAVADTAQQLATRPGRRALVVLTDGVDTSSQLTPAQVSGIASGIDMPVYVVAVGALPPAAGDERNAATGVEASADLSDLARWSGGAFYHVDTPGEGSTAARQIVSELRSQYLLAFESDSSPGWHRIEVRARQRVTLQARSGYWVGPPAIR